MRAAPGTTAPAPRRRVVRLAVLACLVLLALLTGAGPASAHATLISSDPAEGAVLAQAPDVVTFTFDEPVSLPPDGVQVFDATGAPVDASASSRDTVITADLPAELDDGSYVVVWRAVSADGHPIAGSLTFAVGSPSLTVAAPQVSEADPGTVRAVLSITQAVGYVALLVAGGLVLFLLWTTRGVRLEVETRRRLGRVLWGATGVAVVTSLVALPLTGAYQQGFGLSRLLDLSVIDPALIGDDLIVFALTTVGLVVAASQLRRPRLAAVAATAAVISPALVGHSRAIEPVWLLATTDVLHLTAGASWLGGLVGLGLSLGSLAGRERDAALVLARFSEVAAGLLALLAVTGTLMAWRILEGWDPLWHTTYGRLLLVKIAIALLVAAVAGWNRLRLLPLTQDGVGHQARRGATLRVRTAVRVEAGLLVALLGVTGFLVNLSPREVPLLREPVASRVAVAGIDGGLRVLATAAPGVRGPNAVTVQVQDDTGEPVEGYAAPVLSVRGPGGSVDLGTVTAVPIAAGTYEADVVFPTAGRWTIQVSVRRSEFDNPVASVEIEVN